MGWGCCRSCLGEDQIGRWLMENDGIGPGGQCRLREMGRTEAVFVQIQLANDDGAGFDPLLYAP